MCTHPKLSFQTQANNPNCAIKQLNQIKKLDKPLNGQAKTHILIQNNLKTKLNRFKSKQFKISG
jgi:hypothetical protein